MPQSAHNTLNILTGINTEKNGCTPEVSSTSHPEYFSFSFKIQTKCERKGKDQHTFFRGRNYFGIFLVCNAVFSVSVYGSDEKPDSVLCAGSMCCEKQHITYMHRHIDRLQTSECVHNTMNRERERESAHRWCVCHCEFGAFFAFIKRNDHFYVPSCMSLSFSLVSPTNDLNAQIQPEHIFL